MIATYRKKPVEIEAVRFDGSSSQVSALKEWMAGGWYIHPPVQTRDIQKLEISTLEGVMTATAGDYIIRGVQGEFYPCKPDIFEATYEMVVDR